MKEIKVSRDNLLAALQQNRADHRAIFEEAMEGFRTEARAALENRLDDLDKGRRRDIYIVMPVPKDHTSDYDRTIRMVEMSVDDEFVLSEQRFAQYVMDDWGWTSEFLRSSYNSTTAMGKFSDRYVVGNDE